MICIRTTWFHDKFGVTFSGGATSAARDHNDAKLHTVVYLQVTIISQALIFITRSHGWFFMERPSFALMFAFCIAQLVSSIIAAYGDWGFTQIQGVEGGWIGIVWVWVRVVLLSFVFIFMLIIPLCRTSSGSCLWILSSSR